MNPVALALRELGGQASYQKLIRQVSRDQLSKACATGAVAKTGRGRYMLPHLIDNLHEVATAKALGGALSHESAALGHQLEVLHLVFDLHVTLPAGRRRPSRDRLVVHWSDLSPREIAEGRTSIVRTVLDCAATLPLPGALAVADSALRAGVDRADLLSAAKERRGPTRKRIRTVVERADPRAESAFESAVRGVVLGIGIGDFEPQVVIETPGGPKRVDLADRQRRIVIEADSYLHHGYRDALVRDCARYDELVRAGWLVLRFTWEHAVRQQGWIADVVRETRALR